MELGKGYAFVARQQHVHTEKEDYYIDLVFYNYILKCFVLIDLKTNKITHQDVGKMEQRGTYALASDEFLPTLEELDDLKTRLRIELDKLLKEENAKI